MPNLRSFEHSFEVAKNVHADLLKQEATIRDRIAIMEAEAQQSAMSMRATVGRRLDQERIRLGEVVKRRDEFAARITALGERVEDRKKRQPNNATS